MRRLLLLLILLLPASAEAIILVGFGGGSAPAGISHGNDSSGQNASSATTYTLSHNLSAGSGNNRLLVVGVSLDLSGSPTLSCTYNGTAMTALTAATSSTVTVRLFYLLDADLPASAGAYDIVASTSSGGYLKIIASDFTGADQAVPDDSDQNGLVSGSTSVSVTTTTSVNNSLVWAYAAHISSSGNYTGHTEGATLVAELEGGNAHASCATWLVKASAGNQTMTDTASGSDMQAIAVVVFAPAGS